MTMLLDNSFSLSIVVTPQSQAVIPRKSGHAVPSLLVPAALVGVVIEKVATIEIRLIIPRKMPIFLKKIFIYFNNSI